MKQVAMSKTMKELLTPADFASCPVWRYFPDSEAYSEVRALEDLEYAEGTADLQILAQFTTPDGRQLMGQVVGVQNIFAIGLFVNNEILLINRNMRQDSRKQVDKYLALSGLAGELSYETLFPLRFESRWGNATFNDFSGVFEMLP